MKNILLVWNVVLTALVVYLFMSNPSVESTEEASSDSTKIEDVTPKKEQLGNNVYYVNTDSLFEGFVMYEDMQEELVAEQLRMKNRYQGRYTALEKEYNDLRERAPYMTQTQGEEAQKVLMAKQQDLMKMEEKMTQDLAKMEQDMVKKIKASLTAYLEEYQAEKNYQFVLGKSEIGGVLYAADDLDITDMVLEGLNKKYQEENTNAK